MRRKAHRRGRRRRGYLDRARSKATFNVKRAGRMPALRENDGAAFTCGRRRSWRLRLCLAPGLTMLLGANFALRLVLRLAVRVTRRATMRLLMPPAMRLAEGRDWLLPAPN